MVLFYEDQQRIMENLKKKNLNKENQKKEALFHAEVKNMHGVTR